MNIGSISSFKTMPGLRFGDVPKKKSLKDYTKEELKKLPPEELNRLIDESWENAPTGYDNGR